MATDFVLSFIPIRGSIKDLKHFCKDLDLSEMDPSLDLYSKNRKKEVENLKLKSYPWIERDRGSSFIMSKFHKNKTPLNSIESKHKELNHIDRAWKYYRKLAGKKCPIRS